MGIYSIMNDKFKTNLMHEFYMNDLGLMMYFLGMEVHQSAKASMQETCLQNMVWIIVVLF